MNAPWRTPDSTTAIIFHFGSLPLLFVGGGGVGDDGGVGVGVVFVVNNLCSYHWDGQINK